MDDMFEPTPAAEVKTKTLSFRYTWSGVKRVLTYAIASAVMTIGFAFAVASVVGNKTAEQTNDAVAQVVTRVDDTQLLICDILRRSDNPDIRKAVERYCPVPTEGP